MSLVAAAAATFSSSSSTLFRSRHRDPVGRNFAPSSTDTGHRASSCLATHSARFPMPKFDPDQERRLRQLRDQSGGGPDHWVQSRLQGDREPGRVSGNMELCRRVRMPSPTACANRHAGMGHPASCPAMRSEKPANVAIVSTACVAPAEACLELEVFRPDPALPTRNACQPVKCGVLRNQRTRPLDCGRGDHAVKWIRVIPFH